MLTKEILQAFSAFKKDSVVLGVQQNLYRARNQFISVADMDKMQAIVMKYKEKYQSI